LADYFAAMDVFVLPSREDPFPLVCLEAAAAGRPIVCFENAGGMPEFVEDDCGFVVPYMDIEAFAERLTRLIDDSQLRTRMGEAARNKVRSRHNVAVAAPLLFDAMQRTLRLIPSSVGRGQGEGER
jgi:glycosyltransferase involved in cell wall biosynthesis